MRNLRGQTSLFDIYREVTETMENDKPKFFKLVDDCIDWDEIIPDSFWYKFYRFTGRTRKYHLVSFLKMLLIQNVFGYKSDVQLLNTLHYSTEMRRFCGLDKIPDASKITNFKQDFCDEIKKLFNVLVDKTETICRKLNPEDADCLIFDTTGIECCVTENNPKFMSSKLKQAKAIAKNDPKFDPYKGVYSLLPSAASANSQIKQQYINGHFCYALKAGIVTNALGIVRHIDVMDNDFIARHPDIQIDKRDDDPDVDKEIGDSKALKPFLSDFFSCHPTFHYSVFLGDSAFDKYEHYSMLLNEFKFDKAVIPLNPRNSKSANTDFDEFGRPLCPLDGKSFTCLGFSGGKNRSVRLKWVCPCSVQNGNTRICTCNEPCTNSSYGRCVYTYPNKEARLYPGIARESEDWISLYKKRVSAERSIDYFKDTYILGSRKSHNSATSKNDLFIAGITQLITVLIADSISDTKNFRRTRAFVA